MAAKRTACSSLTIAMVLAACTGPAAAPPAGIPFVGCPAGGQMGARPAPRSGPVPAVANPMLAARLAFYSDGDGGVLAPRGWHCVGVTGSSGAALIVTPGRRTVSDILHGEHRYRGPGVQIVYHFGGTSGRFAVAEKIARVFPDYMTFARRVVEDAARDSISVALPSGPYPDDAIVRVSAREVEFTTPAGRTGLGTEGSVFGSDTPISGIVRIEPEEEMSVLQLSHKLAPTDADLMPEIARNFRQWGGRARAPSDRTQ